MTENKRGAGILLHLSSLPSAFGIGDMGNEARLFADFLHRCGQKYWQLLPINPTEQGQGHSPYSSISGKAGNVLFVSPGLLAEEGLLDEEELKEYYLPQEGKVTYANAEKVKKQIFEKAWKNFQSGKAKSLEKNFENFCKKETLWLEDYALYMLLKEQHNGQPWYEWPKEYKLKDRKALKKLAHEYDEKIKMIKWLQFLFFMQWHSLRKYCNEKNVQLFGDLPFYVSYDSADVWSNRQLFSLDKNGNMMGMAGVPPDAFSEDGQLWGMPVYLWNILKKEKYQWWIERLKKNMELFDLLRLDHFRAFADYWEVAASEKTAKKGKWKPGPGAGFFNAVKKELRELPFIAEDLGEINDAVYQLRDEFNFPGMKVLQFAFGEEMPQSPYIPHNYSQNFIAYTGTHDNNTVRGWYRHEGKKYHHQLEKYLGRTLTEDNLPEAMCRLAFASVAKIAIVPIQDVLGIDELGRMNTPASSEHNWQWRLLPGQVTQAAEDRLKEWTILFNRK